MRRSVSEKVTTSLGKSGCVVRAQKVPRLILLKKEKYNDYVIKDILLHFTVFHPCEMTFFRILDLS